MPVVSAPATRRRHRPPVSDRGGHCFTAIRHWNDHDECLELPVTRRTRALPFVAIDGLQQLLGGYSGSFSIYTYLLLDADSVDGRGSLRDDGGAADGLAGASRDAGGERNLAGLGEDSHGFRECNNGHRELRSVQKWLRFGLPTWRASLRRSRRGSH